MVIHNFVPVATIRISHQSDKITIRAMGLVVCESELTQFLDPSN
jgi:hypothetical protein